MTIFWSPTGRAFEFGKQVPFTDPRIANDPRTIAWVTGQTRQGTDDEFGHMDDDLPLDDPTENMDVDGEDLPDLGALIPGNTGGRGRPRDEGGSTDGRNVRPRTGDMTDVGGGGRDGDVEMAARIGGSAGPNSVSKETPISNYPSLTYGLQETHTTILPWVGWFAAAGLDKDAPLQLRLRMNTPWDMVDATMGALGVTDGARLTTKSFYNRGVDQDGRIPSSGGVRFPVEFTDNSTIVNERPQWREFWAKLYDYYTVLGCEYEIHMFNPISVKKVQLMIVPEKTISTVVYPAQIVPVDTGFFNSDVVVATQFDTYSDTATSTGNVMPTTALYEEVRAFKDIKWTHVGGGQRAVIKGTYKPGQAKRNIVNDGDVKTWTATGATLPNLKEILTLNLFCDPFFNARQPDAYGTTASIEPSATGTALKGALHFEVKLKYIVQFKDLKLMARYPHSATTNQDIVLNINENIGDPGNPMMSWNTASG